MSTAQPAEQTPEPSATAPAGPSPADDRASTSAAPAAPPRPTSTFRGVVAVDGPSGTGKSTVSRRLARALRARYLDTGAMYRAAAVGVLRAGVDLDDPAAIAACVAGLDIGISTDAAPAQVVLGGEDVTLAIRGEDATRAVTPVSAVPAVREQLVAQQRELIGRGRIVVEGRDIGTVVTPDAEVKIYLTADARVRAARRAGETRGDAATVQADLERRDHADSTRAASPLATAADAVVVDTSTLDADQVVEQLVAIVARVTGTAGPGAGAGPDEAAGAPAAPAGVPAG